MRKVTATVLWDRTTNQIYNLTLFTTKGVDICLIDYEKGRTPEPYRYATLNDLIASIIKLLANNNFYMEGYTDCGLCFYPLLFVDINNPYEFKRYGYKKGE